MSEEKIIFKCNAIKSVKDSSEAIKVIHKKATTISQIFMSLLLIMLVVHQIRNAMYWEDALTIEAVGYFFTSKFLVMEFIIGMLLIWKVLEIQFWIEFTIADIKRKNIKKPYSSIDFYETFYEIPIFDESTKAYYRYRMNYTDITNFLTSKNLYILCDFKPKSRALKTVYFIRKDSFIEGTEQDFIKFIESKINIE
jgi:hypothetical protein